MELRMLIIVSKKTILREVFTVSGFIAWRMEGCISAVRVSFLVVHGVKNNVRPSVGMRRAFRNPKDPSLGNAEEVIAK